MKDTLNNNAIEARKIYFFRQRHKNKVFQSVINYFVKQAELKGITKKDIAERLGKNPSQITRWFSGPGNWTLDTISDLLLAMEAEMDHSVMPINKSANEVITVFYAEYGKTVGPKHTLIDISAGAATSTTGLIPYPANDNNNQLNQLSS